jgi:AP-3 complex subunit delta-1
VKYYALFAMQKIVPSHPHLIAEYQDMIMESINDEDTSIAMRALDLVSTMVTIIAFFFPSPPLTRLQVNPQNVQLVVQQLLSHLVSDAPSKTLTAAQALTQHTTLKSVKLSTPATQTPSYRFLFVSRILSICSRDMYENITNFEWYLLVLVDLAHVAQVDVGMEIRNQLIDIAVRVQGIRRDAVKLMSSLISEGTILRNAQQAGSCPEVLWAAALVCGEFCRWIAFQS